MSILWPDLQTLNEWIIIDLACVVLLLDRTLLRHIGFTGEA